MSEQSDYLTYRGKCKEYVSALIESDPSLRAVRGYYICPMWGRQKHWWAVNQNGTIIDPTVRQFPTKGVGAEYEEFDGTFDCDQCGKNIPEEKSKPYGNYVFCSIKCACRFVGL